MKKIIIILLLNSFFFLSSCQHNGKKEIMDYFLKYREKEWVFGMFIPVKIDKKDAIFLVDTGSNRTALSVGFANENGIQLGGNIIINRADGTEDARSVDRPLEFSVDEQHRSLISAIALNQFNKKPFRDGIVGMDVLKKLGFYLSMSEQEFYIGPSQAKGKLLDLTYKNNLPYINVKIGKCSFEMLLDSGASEVSLNKDDFEKSLRCSRTKSDGIILTDKNTVMEFSMENIGIVEDAESSKKYSIAKASKNILGATVLGDYKITILPNEEKIYFDKIN